MGWSTSSPAFVSCQSTVYGINLHGPSPLPTTLQGQMPMYQMQMMYPQGQRAFFPAMATGYRPWQGGPVHRPYGFVPQRNRPGGVPRGQMNVGSRMANPHVQRMGGQQRMTQQQMPSGGGQPRGLKFNPSARNPPAPQVRLTSLMPHTHTPQWWELTGALPPLSRPLCSPLALLPSRTRRPHPLRSSCSSH